MKDKAVSNTTHCVLADTEVECPSLSVFLGEIAVLWNYCVVGRSQVGRSSHQIVDCTAKVYQGLSAGTAGCNLVAHIELRQLDSSCLDCTAGHECIQFFCQSRICLLPCCKSLFPAVVIFLPVLCLFLEIILCLREDIEIFFLRDSQCLPGCKHLFLS